MSGARPFGVLAQGAEVQRVTLRAGELTAQILTLGATLQDLRLAGTPWPLTLGADLLAAYSGPMRWFGAIVGPVANRLAGARAKIAGKVARFEANEGANTLHSGAGGTSDQVWQIEAQASDHVTLRLALPDGLGGFPGNRVVRAEYRIIAPATLRLTLSAQSDAPTLMNLAHHPYWNLDGQGDARAQNLAVVAETYLPTDPQNLPQTPPLPLEGSPRDLRQGAPLALVARLDHCFCLAPTPRRLTQVARLRGTKGVTMALSTTAPGLQVYDGAGINTAPYPGLMGMPYGPFSGVALEPQFWPDAPGRADFPSILLEPDTPWQQVTEYRFSRADLAGDSAALGC